LTERQLNFASLAPLLVLTLALAACGGGSGAAPDGGDATQNSVATTDATNLAIPVTVASSSTETTTPPDTPSTPASTPPSSSPTPAPATDTPQVIEYYGDSTVWGYRTDVGGQVAAPAPAVFAEALPDPFAYIVRNEGVNSSTACDLLNGTDGRHPSWASQMAASKAGYVVVNHAINDQWRYDVNTYRSCLHTLAQTARHYGKQMIFETPNPTRDSGSWGLDIYVAAMKEVASQENVPVFDQYAYLTAYLNGRSPYTICPDGLHPTEAVYAMKGKYAAGIFTDLFIR
jgi:lysophospholipase L1-like esterase